MKITLTLLFALTSLMFFGGCHPGPVQDAVAEYRVDIVNFKHEPPNGLQDYLNTMSKDGWRLVQFVEHDEWYRVVLTRPKK
jgi:hypothetical protein